MVDKPRRVKPEEEKEAMETLPEVDLGRFIIQLFLSNAWFVVC